MEKKPPTNQTLDINSSISRRRMITTASAGVISTLAGSTLFGQGPNDDTPPGGILDDCIPPFRRDLEAMREFAKKMREILSKNKEYQRLRGDLDKKAKGRKLDNNFVPHLELCISATLTAKPTERVKSTKLVTAKMVELDLIAKNEKAQFDEYFEHLNQGEPKMALASLKGSATSEFGKVLSKSLSKTARNCPKVPSDGQPSALSTGGDVGDAVGAAYGAIQGGLAGSLFFIEAGGSPATGAAAGATLGATLGGKIGRAVGEVWNSILVGK